MSSFWLFLLLLYSWTVSWTIHRVEQNGVCVCVCVHLRIFMCVYTRMHEFVCVLQGHSQDFEKGGSMQNPNLPVPAV